MADKVDELAGTQRAAILLMSLGEQDAANVLKQLDAREVQKLGIAMAARRPMMATTIMISTSVKPACFRFNLVNIIFYCVGLVFVSVWVANRRGFFRLRISQLIPCHSLYGE